MARVLIESLATSLEAAYRDDDWHSLHASLRPLTPELWRARPAEHSVEIFGTDPELAVVDIVAHLGAAKRMYANRAFGDASASWGEGDLLPPSRDIDGMLAWLEAGHQQLAAGLASLEDDADLRQLRMAHWGEAIPVERFVRIMVHHDLYHSGEINRQLSLLRGTSGGWVAGD